MNELDKPVLARPLSVWRKCPACKVEGYHDGEPDGVRRLIRCAFCKHEWNGRIFETERR